MDKNSVVFLFISLILVFLFFSKNEEVCINIKKGKMYSYEKAMTCINSVAFSEPIRKATIDTLLKFYPLYAFKDISLDSGPPFFVKAPVEKDLENLKTVDPTTTFNSKDYKFQKEVYKIFAALHDAHTSYHVPKCYYSFYFYQPFALTSTLNNLNQVVQIADYPASKSIVPYLYGQFYPEDKDQVYKYTNWTILTIDGEETIQHLEKFGNTYSTLSRDPSIRFNRLLDRYGGWNIRSAGMIPDKNSITYEIQNPQTLEKKTIVSRWVAIPTVDIEFESGFKELCLPPLKTRMISNSQSNLKSGMKKFNSFFKNYDLKNQNYHIGRLDDDLQNYQIQLMNNQLSLNQINQLKELNEKNIITGNDDYVNVKTISELKFVINHKTKTGIFTVPTFAPFSTDDWAKDVYTIAKSFYTNKISKLIIDVRGNGGGDPFLGYALVRFLSPYSPIEPDPVLDMKQCELGKKLYCSSNFQARFNYFDPFNMGNRVNDDWYSTQKFIYDRNKNSSYTYPFYRPSGLAGYFPKLSNPPVWGKEKIQFTPNNLIVLSDGTAGSAAGAFVKLLQQVKLAKFVSMGGIFKRGKMEISSFKGAGVLNSRNFRIEGCLDKTKDANILPPPDMFKTSAFLTYVWYEKYNWKPAISVYEKEKTSRKVPGDFHFDPADFHIWSWDLSPRFNSKIFDQVEGFFKKCNPKWGYLEENDPKICKPIFNNVIMGYPCSADGTGFNKGDCVAVNCKKGYYLSEDKKQCKLMPGTIWIAQWPAILLNIVVITLLVIAGLVVLVSSFCICCLGLFFIGYISGSLSSKFKNKKKKYKEIDHQKNNIQEPNDEQYNYST